MLDDIRSASNGEGKWDNVCVERFVGQLRARPWIEPALVDLVAHGLRTAVRDPDQSLWQQLREVIRDEDDLVGHQLTRISRITAAHLNGERARRASH
jgi:hypothetical protein